MSERPQDETALTIFSLVIGFCLWVQVLGPGAWSEIQSVDGRVAALFVDVAPLFVLIVGAIIRSRLTLAVGFMVAMIPGILFTPEHLVVQLHTGIGLVRIGGTAAFYLAAIAIAFTRLAAPKIEGKRERAHSNEHARHVYSRAAISIVLLLTIFQALHFDPVVAQTIAQSYDDHRIATVFISLALFFIWAASTYMFMIVPSLNYEHDKRRLARSFRQDADQPTARFALRHSPEIGVVALFVGLLVVL